MYCKSLWEATFADSRLNNFTTYARTFIFEWKRMDLHLAYHYAS
jgi:hypothetical protein